MSLNTDKIIVMRIQTSTGTYFASNYIGGVTLDNESYDLMIQSVGESSHIGNFGEGHENGSCHVVMVNGPKFFQGKVTYDITRVWNNKKCYIKLCDISAHSTWAACEDYYNGIIKNFSVSNGLIEFDIENKNYKDEKIVPRWTVEDQVRLYDKYDESEISEDSRGKRIPIQYGSLDDDTNGIFGKGILLTEKIGHQQIYFDRRPLNTFTKTGIWSDKSKRFYQAQQIKTNPDSTTNLEYEVYINNNAITFIQEQVTFITANMNVSAAGSIEQITVDDYTKILSLWVNDDDYIESYSSLDWRKSQGIYKIKLVRINLRIDDEIITVVRKPTSSTIWVTRGVDDTDAVAHTAGEFLSLCNTYASRGYAVFSERFAAKEISTQWYAKNALDVTQDDISDFNYDNSFEQIIDGDTSTYFQFYTATNENSWLLFNTQFDNIEDDYDVTGVYPALYFAFEHDASTFDGSAPDFLRIYLYDSLASITPIGTSTGSGTATSVECFRAYPNNISILGFREIDWWTSAQRINTSGVVEGYTLISISNISEFYNETYMPSGEAIQFDTLKNLSNRWKWKFSIGSRYADFRIYAMGLWVDFIANINDKPLLFYGKGREVEGLPAAITGGSGLIEYPIDAVVDILVLECQYTILDISTTGFSDILTYEQNSSVWGTYTPTIALSFGVDESKKGFDFAQKISSEHMLMLWKEDSGLARCLNLHQLQNNDVTYGYPSLTSYKISIDDILMHGTEKALSIKQTGTDRLRNACVINYNRNNSTNKFQSIYPTLKNESVITELETTGDTTNGSAVISGIEDPSDFIFGDYIYVSSGFASTIQQIADVDSSAGTITVGNNATSSESDIDIKWVTTESNRSVKECRDYFYEGQKTDVWKVDAISIYTKRDAARLWRWHMQDKAEVFIWVELTVDYDHYNLIQSPAKSKQYEIGDIVYLNGIIYGLVFDSSHLFVIRNIIKKSHGQEVEIHAKSIEPISEFTSDVSPQNLEWQNTVDTGDEWQDTVDTGDEWQNKI